MKYGLIRRVIRSGRSTQRPEIEAMLNAELAQHEKAMKELLAYAYAQEPQSRGSNDTV